MQLLKNIRLSGISVHSFFAFALCLSFCGSLVAEPQTLSGRVERIELPASQAKKITGNSLAIIYPQLPDDIKSQIDRTLVRLECEHLGITVTEEEIDAEVQREAEKVWMTNEEFLQSIQQGTGISPEQCRQNYVWQYLAREKLADPRLSISMTELVERYETKFGPAVSVDRIVFPTRDEAEAILAEVRQHPGLFRIYAREFRSNDPLTEILSENTWRRSFPYSVLPYSVRRHVIDPDLENILFAMELGEISSVIEHPPGYFTIFRCSGHRPPRDDVSFYVEEEQLRREIRDEKLPKVTADLFRELHNRAQIQIVSVKQTTQRTRFRHWQPCLWKHHRRNRMVTFSEQQYLLVSLRPPDFSSLPQPQEENRPPRPLVVDF